MTYFHAPVVKPSRLCQFQTNPNDTFSVDRDLNCKSIVCAVYVELLMSGVKTT